MADTLVALDIEATGMDPARDEVIEIGAVKFRGQKVVDCFETFVRPRGQISLGIRSLTGLSNEELRSAPFFSVVSPKLRDFIRNAPIVGQSVGMDLDMLAAAGLGFANVRYDTFELATILLPELPAYNLATIATTLGVPTAGRHRAVADAETTMRVFNGLVERAEEFDDATLERLRDVTKLSGSQLAHLFSAMLRERRGVNAPGEATIGAQLLAQLAGGAGHGPEAMFLMPRERPAKLEETDSQAPVAASVLTAAMAARGMFAAAIDGFEERPQQLQMMQAIAENLNWGGQLLVEAGTGTGKSLGYLLPAALHARQRGDRVVVSTATIALQDQLMKKDVPALIDAASNVRADGPDAPLATLRDLKVALLKGRANYLCLRRWFLAQRDDVTGPLQAQLYAKVISWLQQTDTGDSAELHLSPDQRALWGRLSAEDGACVPAQCVFHRRNQCFLFRARHEAEAAHVVVVNHSLLLSDLLTGRSALPSFKQLIIDEAHHLEDEATAQVGYALGRNYAGDLIRRAIVDVEPLGLAGAIGMAFRAIASSGAAGRATEIELQPHLTKAVELGKRCMDGIERVYHTLVDFVSRYDQGSGGYEHQLRVTDAVRRDPGWSQLEIEWDDLLQPIGQLLELTLVFDRAVEALSDDDLATRSEIRTEFELLARDIDTFRERMTALVSQPDAGMIYWVAKHPSSGEASGHAAPIFVGDVLNEKLFQHCESVTLTSATLTTDGTFDYIRERLALEHADELRVPSPFDYQHAAMLAITDDVPEPGGPGHQKRLQEAIVEMCVASRGRAMVLFTSHSALQAAHRAIKRPLEQQGILVLGQRIDGSPRQLIERLRAHPRTVVLGTNSFWEGVDIVGEALSLLVITKLPFPVPSDPIFAARSEQFDDAFNHFAVPQAILRFKQGFGRLIRSADDRGVCVVLDRRIATRRYGGAFVNSLPGCAVRVGPTEDVSRAVEEFLAAVPRHPAAHTMESAAVVRTNER